MIVANSSLPGWAGARQLASCMNMFMMLAILATLAACGGGAGTTAGGIIATAECDPNDPSTFAECGTVMVALTDADGDFLNYTVDVLSLKLETADGRIVETLPRTTRINFTDYVDLAELVVTASIPPAIYVSGVISIDYADAEVFVESGGDAVAAIVTDIAGDALTQTDLKIVLSDRDRLNITRGRASLLQLDFDLDASHTVDISTIPATAVAEQFIIAEVTPVDEKEIRVRGPLISVSEDAMTYTVAIRPFMFIGCCLLCSHAGLAVFQVQLYRPAILQGIWQQIIQRKFVIVLYAGHLVTAHGKKLSTVQASCFIGGFINIVCFVLKRNGGIAYQNFPDKIVVKFSLCEVMR